MIHLNIAKEKTESKRHLLASAFVSSSEPMRPVWKLIHDLLELYFFTIIDKISKLQTFKKLFGNTPFLSQRTEPARRAFQHVKEEAGAMCEL